MTVLVPRLAGLVVATLVAAAGLVGLSPAPASAAVCGSAGISAVVDAAGAGGGTSTHCDAVSGSRNAAEVFKDVGVSVTRNRDGSVCQVDGLPKDATCQGLGTKYWALFWSDGKDGTWNYSNQGDASLTVPANGSVAWAWQSSSGQRKPGVKPPVVKAAPKPTPTPTTKPVAKPTKKATSKPTKKGTVVVAPATTSSAAATAAAPTATPSASTKPRGTKAPTPIASPTAAASSSESATPSETLDPSPDADAVDKADGAFAPEEEHSGLPTWIPVTVILVLALGAFGGLWWRNRTGQV